MFNWIKENIIMVFVVILLVALAGFGIFSKFIDLLRQSKSQINQRKRIQSLLKKKQRTKRTIEQLN